jgi:hypothetical protein
MQLTFLQADEPLTKKYTRRPDGGYDSESYPMLSQVTSHVEDVETIDEFELALKKHAELGHCLHTGSLDRPLENESRKGHHDRDEARRWIVLDLDGLSSFNGVDEFLEELPKAFQQTSYIVQHSPSSGIKPGIRAHVYFLLDRDEAMQDIKTWIIDTNLATEKLRNEITLTAKDFALSYPLDKVANDNGRVVYITAPQCEGFADPVVHRISVVRKDHSVLRHDFRRAVVSEVKALERSHIDKLREDKGLKKSRVKDYYERRGDIDVLKRNITEPGRIHPVRQDSDFVVRCNLDDGDSEAYFYYIEFPTLLRNHKGEPCLFMEAVDKKYYDEVAFPEAKKCWEKNVMPFVFRNKHDDSYYAGARQNDEIIVQPHKIGSHDKIKSWFFQVAPHVVPPDLDQVENWEVKFDPTFGKQWNPDERVFNTWKQTDIMAGAQYRSVPPVTITKVIAHALGNSGVEYNRFINWLAYIYQTRQKTGTAWILHGVQGTGKGLLVDHILTPLFGYDYVRKQQARDLRADFNGWMEKAIFVNLDEFDVHDTGDNKDSVMAALKNWITDTRVSIRHMYAGHRMTDNFTNFIVTTNSQHSIPVPVGERRFSFGKRQEKRLEITPDEVDLIKEELSHFAGYLSGYDVDRQEAHTCLENSDKKFSQELSKTTIEEFVEAVQTGDLLYFDVINNENVDFDMGRNYKQLLDRMIKQAGNDDVSYLTLDEMLHAYQMATGGRKVKAKVLKTLAHKGLKPTRVRMEDDSRPNVFTIKWDLSAKDKVLFGTHLKAVEPQKIPGKKELQDPISPPSIE